MAFPIRQSRRVALRACYDRLGNGDEASSSHAGRRASFTPFWRNLRVPGILRARMDCASRRSAVMRALSTFTRILLHRGIVDFRKGRRSLAALVEVELKENPFSPTLFLFMSRRRDCIRALYWDKTGFALWEKGLEEARFPWPRASERKGQVLLTDQQLEWLLSGVDIWKLRPHSELEYSRVC